MDPHVTRPILWNVPLPFIALMYGLLLALVAAAGYAGLRWSRIIRLGRADDSLGHLGRRLAHALRDGVGQGAVVREPWGWMHYTFYIAFIGLALGTSIVFVNSDVRALAAFFGLRLYFYFGDFYRLFKAAMDTFFLMLAAGVLMESARRIVRKPALLAGPPAGKAPDNWEDRLGYWFPMTMMMLAAGTGLMLEGARINALRPDFTEWAYLGRELGRIEGALGAGARFHRALWLAHMLLVYALLFCFPFTKLRHLVFGPLNLFLQNLNPRGRLRPIKNFETAETFGVSKVEEYTWKQLLDMAACLECGRCTLLCPTVHTGKALNPKHLVIAQREHLLQEAPRLLAAKSAARNGGEPPGAKGPDMITEVASEAAVWGCTTCGWCEEGCPVGIEHIQRIVDMRRYDVLMESRFAPEATAAFKGIEAQGNPWGLAQERRAEWAKALGIPEMADLRDPSELDVLYWVGCAGSYDERSRKASRAFAALMKQAGVRFAILGREETCTGDPARRLGNEYLYATVAQRNVQTLNRYHPRRIVTQCPHCFHALKNEYPDFGGDYRVVHEAEFIDELIRAGRLKPKNPLPERITYHDPCYMARHNRQWDGARAALRAIPGAEVADVVQSKSRTFCCGAGGGCFWKEEREGARINLARLDQLGAAEPNTVAVGCPFCMTMLEDAVKARSMEERMRVRSISELVAESTEAGTK